MHGLMGPSHLLQWLSVMHSLGPSLVLVGGIYLVERRGKKKEALNPSRQVSISGLLESIPEAAFIVDTQNRIIDANTAAAQLLGCHRDNLLGSHARQLKADLVDGHRSPILGRALEGHAVRHERRVVQNPVKNEQLELLISATPLKNEHGQVVAALLIARDVTELTALQRRLGDLERHLAIGQMAASLAHDFNNILASIEQSAYLLQTGAARSEAEERSFVDVIQTAVRRGSEIIGRVREYLRTGSGAIGPVDLRQILQEAIDLTRPLWTRNNVRVMTELHPVPKVRANSADLRRVFTNLIINAIEAMPQGGQIVATCQDANGRVVATVSDTGTGIAPENRERIFYPYFTTKQKGTGLGLSGAQKIILSQGGNISFRTEMGKGTTFIVTLPTADTRSGSTNARDDKKPAA